MVTLLLNSTGGHQCYGFLTPHTVPRRVFYTFDDNDSVTSRGDVGIYSDVLVRRSATCNVNGSSETDAPVCFRERQPEGHLGRF